VEKEKFTCASRHGKSFELLNKAVFIAAKVDSLQKAGSSSLDFCFCLRPLTSTFSVFQNFGEISVNSNNACLT
jgi:hypothetical protein